MKKSKITKQALIFSITSILICIIMLIGSTFAWFTDSVTGGKNVIKAGNLDVELYHSNGTVAKEKVLADTKLFEVDLWEPGVMAYENFEVRNEGDLALKFNFNMSIAAFNTVLESGKSLKDVLKVAILEDGEFTGNRVDASKLTFDKTLADFEREAELVTKGQKDTFAIIVYWQPSELDNDYNLNNGKVSSDNNPLFIELGINLIATQTTHESDSFGNDYDDQIVYKEVATADDFNSKIYYAKENEGIRLTEDIALPWSIPQNKDGNSIIDLNGHTLSTSVAASNIITNNSNMTIKNGKLKLLTSGVSKAALSVETGSSLTLENVEFTTNTGAGIYPKGDAATVNIINSTITTEGTALGTNANSVDNYNVQINIKNSNISSTYEGVGTAIVVNIPCQVNIESSTINGYFHGLVVRGGNVTVKDSTITNTTDDATAEQYEHYFDDKNWGTNNAVNLAALTIGNKYPGSYQYPSNVTLINTKVEAKLFEGSTRLLPTVYIIGNEGEGLGATLTYDAASSVGEVIRGNEHVTVNGQ